MALRIMLDTSAYSSYLGGREPLQELLRRADAIYMTPIVIGELLAGFARGKSEARNRGLLRRFLSTPRITVTEVDEETSERYAFILNHLRAKGSPVPTNDLWIAASAMQHGVRLVTSDRHFDKIPQVILERFEQDTAH